jgi:predicted nicotinamide N-methyase
MQRNIVHRLCRVSPPRVLQFEALSEYEVTLFDSFSSVGGKVWPSAEHLVSFIQNNDMISPGMRIIELGSGCGYTGISLGALGARKVVLTDLLISQHRAEYDMEGCLDENAVRIPSAILLDLCRRNADLNAKSLSGCKISVCELQWGKQNEHMLLNLIRNEGPFDVVVGSDLTYFSNATESLFWTVSRLLGSPVNTDVNSGERFGEKLKFITAHQKRRESSTVYTLECAKAAGLMCTTLQEDDSFVIWEFSVSLCPPK